MRWKYNGGDCKYEHHCNRAALLIICGGEPNRKERERRTKCGRIREYIREKFVIVKATESPSLIAPEKKDTQQCIE